MNRFAADLKIITESAGSLGADDFRHLAEGLPQLVWTSDPNGKVDYISPHMSVFTGIKQDDPAYLDWPKLIHPDDSEEMMKIWLQCMETGESFIHEFRMRGADGTYQWFSGRGVPVIGIDGQIVKWYGATTNIDKLKNAELSLMEAAEEKDRFIAILGHELRNPLSAISNSYQSLVHGNIGEEQKGRALDSLGRQIGYLKRLVEETLDISRLASGKFRLLPTKVELNHLVESCVRDMGYRFLEEEVSLETALAPKEIWVKGDSVRLSQCINNLLNNSVKFTPSGGKVTVGCSLDPETNLAGITVSDNGVGMTEEELARIFRPFSQGRSAGRLSREGLGLGLAITNEIIGLHGGDISVSSEGKGKGSVFTLNIPAAKAPGAQQQEHSEPEEQRNGLETMKVLLVDDDKGVSATLKMFLELEGHTVTVANCGRTAFGALDRDIPDIIFCDISLPGTIKGWDVVKRVVTNYPDHRTPYIVALSGHAEPHHINRCLEAGFDEHLAKPTSPEDLRKALARAAQS